MAAGDSGPEVAALVQQRIVEVPDFPRPGIGFKDLTPLYADPAAFRQVVDAVVRTDGFRDVGTVVGIEARGFLLAAGIAYATGTRLVLVRKAGKLPRATHAATYELEYGEATLEIHQDAFALASRFGSQASPNGGRRTLIVDDVLATGGTARATCELVERAGGDVAGVTVVVELDFLSGRQAVPRPVHALLTTG